MKKVKYNGDIEAILPTLGKVVNKGDVIDVEDSFYNALFTEVKEEKAVKSKEVNTDGK